MTEPEVDEVDGGAVWLPRPVRWLVSQLALWWDIIIGAVDSQRAGSGLEGEHGALGGRKGGGPEPVWGEGLAGGGEGGRVVWGAPDPDPAPASLSESHHSQNHESNDDGDGVDDDDDDAGATQGGDRDDDVALNGRNRRNQGRGVRRRRAKEKKGDQGRPWRILCSNGTEWDLSRSS